MKPYEVKLEISGPTAMWTRPDTGSSPVSYVAPTFSAVKGIFESILRWKSVNIRPTKVEICQPVQFHRYTTNYGGPLRASDAIAKGASFQFYAVVLVNVCYRLYAETDFAGHRETETPRALKLSRRYHDRFNLALEQGRWFYTPCLGWKEFAPDYIGPFRPETRVCETEEHELPTMLRMVFDQPQDGKINPSYYNPRNHPNLRIERGVLHYAE
ncbi:MAG: CRISPR-associated protein Cas5 [Elusimicrobia bacterium]|nr:CRISPR-associated protein Cas5 [Elusimicrobiota bacterium]